MSQMMGPKVTLDADAVRRGVRIDDAAAMDPFLMAIVSGGDRWMYAASTGGLTCGRRDADGALFPYETDDQLCAADGSVGPRSILWVQRDDVVRHDGVPQRWEPFLRAADGLHRVRRSLWKSTLSDEVWFEEQNHDLGLTLRYGWRSGQRFGFIRDVELRNDGQSAVHVRLLDGLVAILPADVDRGMQAAYSNLVDAYKQSELRPGTDLALYRLSSIPIDRAIPNEALRTNAAWVRGLPAPMLLLSTRQLEAFRRGEPVQRERHARGVRGALLAASELSLEPGASARWCFGLDTRLDARAVVALERQLGSDPMLGTELRRAIDADFDEDRARLHAHVAAADGLQSTADPVEDARHLANTLFNAMRGGTFVDDGRVDLADFSCYLEEVAPRVAERHDLSGWPARCSRRALVDQAQHSGDADLERLAREYLPLTFSRRHGDPSRPWNQFAIDTHNADGSRRLRYEGNWRDIFQNWEALLHSYPEYAEAAVVKFVNATTVDGYNPYRISREGFDWEVPDPADPWAHIGYWGDHQVVYLQRLLELCERLRPGGLAQLLRRAVFVFADVPYRLTDYGQLLENPHETISFDEARDADIRSHEQSLGNEARLLHDGSRGAAEPRRAGLAEKLLVPILAKLSNFVPGLGIWMNTQRPEWNDANNALVGRGVSVVTAAYLLRHCECVQQLLANAGDAPLPVSAATAAHLRETAAVLVDRPAGANARTVLDRLGAAGARYRTSAYSDAVGGRARVELPVGEALTLLSRARLWLLATVRAHRRDDNLAHSYNLLDFDADGDVTARRLPPMLEGQVAALGSGALDAAEAADLLDALAESPLRRHDLGTYLLYPDRSLPEFMEQGVVANDEIDRSPLLQELLAANRDGILRRCAQRIVRFAPGLRNAKALAAECEALSLPQSARVELAALYERVFDHAAYTGRSGAFCGYEGLGSVYWHMVSKLRLAVLETWRLARVSHVDRSVLDRLRHHYEDIRRGLGVGLPPERYGAFPSDPYSHTPAEAGVRQPGMTGQVKEDLLARRLELGVHVEDGCLGFGDVALRPGASLRAAWRGPLGAAADCEVPAASIGFSVCGVPVTLREGEQARVTASLQDGRVAPAIGARLDRELSAAVFGRTGLVTRIDVTLPPV